MKNKKAKKKASARRQRSARGEAGRVQVCQAGRDQAGKPIKLTARALAKAPAPPAMRAGLPSTTP